MRKKPFIATKLEFSLRITKHLFTTRFRRIPTCLTVDQERLCYSYGKKSRMGSFVSRLVVLFCDYLARRVCWYLGLDQGADHLCGDQTTLMGSAILVVWSRMVAAVLLDGSSCVASVATTRPREHYDLSARVWAAFVFSRVVELVVFRMGSRRSGDDRHCHSLDDGGMDGTCLWASQSHGCLADAALSAVGQLRHGSQWHALVSQWSGVAAMNRLAPRHRLSKLAA